MIFACKRTWLYTRTRRRGDAATSISAAATPLFEITSDEVASLTRRVAGSNEFTTPVEL